MPSRAASAAPSLRAVPAAKITTITATTSQMPDVNGIHAAEPVGHGHTLRYSVYPSTIRPATGTMTCHSGTGSLCRTNTSMMQPTEASTYTTSRISVPMVADQKKLLNALAWADTAVSTMTMTAAIPTTTKVAQTGVL